MASNFIAPDYDELDWSECSRDALGTDFAELTETNLSSGVDESDMNEWFKLMNDFLGQNEGFAMQADKASPGYPGDPLTFPGNEFLDRTTSELSIVTEASEPMYTKKAAMPRQLSSSCAKRERRRSGPPKPARFCHACWRSGTETNQLIICSNFKWGKCRKVECERCVGSKLETLAPRPCSHCAGTCGPKAQCQVYTKTNMRRKQLSEMRSRSGSDA